jgi:curli biogenesis system outer membrane secretion channel CsgG
LHAGGCEFDSRYLHREVKYVLRGVVCRGNPKPLKTGLLRYARNDKNLEDIMKTGIGVLGLLALILCTASCATSATSDDGVTTTVTTGGPTVTEVTTYQGPKARIAVARFEMKAAQGYGEIGTGMSDMLVDALFQTNRFIVLERGEGLSDIKEELALSESGYTEKGKAAEKGTLEGADILLTGAITEFEPNAEGAGGGGIGITLFGGIGIGGKTKKASIAAQIRMVDVRTGRVISSGRVEGKASDFKFGVVGGVGVGGGVVLAGGFGKYKNTPMEKAVRVMLDNAVKEITKSVPADYYRYKPETK